MRNGHCALKLIFGILGATYAVMGGVFLGIAVSAAGELRGILALPEDQLTYALLGVTFAGLGILFLIVTLCLHLADRRRERLREELRTWGSRVQGEVIGVDVDHLVRVSRRSPSRARVRCTLPSGEVILRSPMLWQGIPAVGDRVDVLYDPMDEKRRVIDLPPEK